MAKNQTETPSVSKDKKTKIVNLFEDMNHHPHDEKSYKKMVKLQESQK